MAESALAILELSLIARGIRVSDAVVKKAKVKCLRSGPVSSGNYLLMLRGGVAEIEEAITEGIEVAGESLIASLELAYLSQALWPLLPTTVRADNWAADPSAESVCIVETTTVCATVHAADAALKMAPVTIRDIQLATGIGGYGFFTMTGQLCDIEAARDIARDTAGSRLRAIELIAQPAEEIRGQLLRD